MAATKPTNEQNAISGEHQSPDTETTAEMESVWNSGKVRALVGLIIVMSLILAVGFGFFIYKVTQILLLGGSNKAETQIEAVNNPILSLPPAADINLNGFKIQHLTANQQQIILHVRKQGQAELWLFDQTTNKISKKIRLIK